ncbi:MAG: hypothetical protein JWM27_796, partial [Gemmatimonadetes bacterium]|nr:hypothetical protein [Gemmatimonadota bacterium]
MSSNFSRPGAQSGPAVANAWQRGPNAAVLIDFDNVTMGVRSDLGKELKLLLNSSVFNGNIAVRRAYADWRRYPNYVVPLTESSVDLVFAPAYGTSKKNATDLRMAVDAIELAFMRPEIGTFILLTGDSDFTSCVVKLKEYGKYVIGVGMRESSSDLLIQCCDEYYSYHALSGLTRANVGDEAKEDPWLLVKKAAKEMARNRDAMRTDRLKQVMIEMDPGFDEKNLQYSKFSKFVSDAAAKGLIRLKRVENGQYEIVPVEDSGAEDVPDAYRAGSDRERSDRDRGSRDRDRGRGRGRFGRDRDRGPRMDEPRVITPSDGGDHGDHGDHGRQDYAEEHAYAADAPAAPYSRDEAAEPARYEAPAAQAPSVESASSAPAAQPAAAGNDAIQTVSSLEGAYGLLQQAVRGMVGGKIGQAVRDGDVKRRMLDLAPGFDEGKLGFSKFSRFLRSAHDHEAIDLRRLGEGSYEVALPASGTKLPPPVLVETDIRNPAAGQGGDAQAEAPREGRGSGRGRGRGRGRGEEGAPPIFAGQGAGGPGDAEAPRDEAPRSEEAPAAAPREEREAEPTRPTEKMYAAAAADRAVAEAA